MKSIKVKKNRLKTLKETLKIRNQVEEVFKQSKMVENIRLKPKLSHCFTFLDFAKIQGSAMVGKNTFRLP